MITERDEKKKIRFVSILAGGKTEGFGVDSFMQNEWTEFARKHKLDVRMTPIVHRRPRLGSKVGSRPMLDGQEDLYMPDNAWSEFLAKQKESKRTRRV